MAIRRRGPRAGLVSTKIPVYTLNSVGRQSPNRRQPNEAENIDNALVSLERNFEKRPGFEIVPQKTAAEASSWDISSKAIRLDLYSLASINSTHDLWYYWYSINEDNTFLVVIDFDATGATEKLFYVFRVFPSGTWEELTPQNQWDGADASIPTTYDSNNADSVIIEAYRVANSITYAAALASGVVKKTSRAYLTHGSGTKTAKESLKAVSLGSSVVVLNKNVFAGFSSDVAGKLFDLNGAVTANDDIAGRKLTYYTASKVMKVFNLGDDGLAATADDVLLGWRPSIITGQATSGSATHIHLAASASNAVDAYVGMTITITSGTGAGQTRRITAYTGGTTKIATVDTNWSTHPSSSSYYSIDLSTTVITGTAQNGASTTITLAASSSAVSGYYAGATISITSGTGSGQTKTITAYNGSTKVATVDSDWTTNPNNTSVYSITIKSATYIPAEDYYYFDSTLDYLGQKVNDISDIRLPPDDNDWFANNSNLDTSDIKARQMLRILHDPDTPYNNIIDGRGKIYFTVNPYLNSTSGFYRVISWNPTGNKYYYSTSDGNKGIYTFSGTTGAVTHTTEIVGAGRPYLQKVRTPDEHSYIDPNRMPQKLSVVINASNVTAWSVAPIDWTPRTTGDKKTNPGPSIFKTVDRKSLRQVKITGLAVFKDRLWFSADDVIFSSQTGEYENLFYDDPSNIVITDPIDIRVSSNNYCEITSMTPFEEYMFINTKANTQFQLMSANGQEMSPTNVAVAPVTYYSTAPILDPQFIGSRLYFFDSQRLFLFTGKGSMGYASAAEVSSQAAGYLPRKYRAAATAPAQDTLLFVDDDNRNHIYGYINRFSGERVIQNSFYRYLLENTDSIESLQCFDNYMYVVSKRKQTASSSSYYYYIYRNLMLNEDVYVPRLDRMFKMKIISSTVQATNWNADYDPYTTKTIFRIPGHTEITDISKYFVVLFKGWQAEQEDLSNVAIQPYSVTNITDGSGNKYTEITTLGANYSAHNYYVYIGLKFKMRVELSTLFVRDENNNIIDGVLNIRSGVFRHYFTGPYDIEVTHRGRPAFTTSYVPTRPEYTIYEDTLPLEIFQVQGEFATKIMGYSDSTKITISSEYPTPVNITNMEFKGKFKQKYTTIDT